MRAARRPERSRARLPEGEKVLLDQAPHWWFLLPRFLGFVAVLAVGIGVVVLGRGRWPYVELVLTVGTLVASVAWLERVGGYVATGLVLTEDRVLYRSGILRRRRQEIPLERINQAFVEQRVFERWAGAGTVIIESAGEPSRTSLRRVRDPERVVTQIYSAMDANEDRGNDRLGQAAARGGVTGSLPAAEQLEKLSDLRERGALTEAEFEAQKRRILGDDAAAYARVVSTGFASPEQPDQIVPGDQTLVAGETYLFWFEIGEPQEGSIDREHVEIPDKVPDSAELDVVVFADGGGAGDLRFTSPNVGRIRLNGGEPPSVIEPSHPLSGTRSRLYFEMVAPAPGRHSFRCNVYYQQALVQSRLVWVTTSVESRSEPGALETELDFFVSLSMEPEWLAARAPHRFSLMVNATDDSHRFMFAGRDGEGPLFSSTSIPEGTIGHLVDGIRGGLRKACYGSEAEYDENTVDADDFKYDGKPDLDLLSEDLILLAVRGYRLYLEIVPGLARIEGAEPPADPRDARLAFEQKTRRPGLVQLASPVAPTLYLPIAVIYDHPLDDARVGHRLCSAFLAALAEDTLSSATPCFGGDCPERDDQMVVCPSGFWGYRHAIGVPPSGAFSALDPTQQLPQKGVTQIRYADKPVLVGAHATDLDGPAPHHDHLLKSPLNDGGWFDNSDDLFTALEEIEPHLIYLYCHGGVSPQAVPYLRVGAPGDTPITPARVQTGPSWATRPLVFINGCHTTAVHPRSAYEFVSKYTGEPRASGVIGTEVTIREPLARTFAEAFFSAFVPSAGAGMQVGEAVRSARMAVLAGASPLGLVYTPFVSPDVSLVA